MPDRHRTKAQLIQELETQRREVRRLHKELARPRQQDDTVAAAPADPVSQASAVRYRSVVDHIVDGVITIDSQGVIESINPAAEQMFGYREGECRGQNVGMLIPAACRNGKEDYFQRYRSQGTQSISRVGQEVEGRRKDGSVFPLELSVSQFELGSRRMFTGIIRDITRRKELETQLLQAQKMESIGQLAGGVAHDFNNQLGIILFDVDLLLAGTQEHTELREDLLKIRKVVLRSANLARQLLLFSRRQQLEPRPTDLNHHVRELRKMLGRLLGRPIEIQLDLTDALWRVNADPSTLDQVILNLAINSRDAMPDGGLLRFETSNVVMDERDGARHAQARPGRYACLRVIDNGVGMGEDVRLRVFEPFFTTKAEGRGTGLGLSVVYGIVQAHDGWIQVTSTPDQGSCFTVFLPALQEGVAGAAQPDNPAPGQHRSGQGEHILLLEDEAELRERARIALREHHYAVSACGSIADARAALEQSGHAYDLIISDVFLPDGRGTELIFQLHDRQPELPALLTTGYVDDHPDWDRVRKQRIAVLQKPFSLDTLLERVRQALETGGIG